MDHSRSRYGTAPGGEAAALDDNYYEPLTVTVGPEDAGKQVRAVLQRRLGVSRKLLSQVKLTERGLTVNERRVYTTATVSEGDVIRLRMEREESTDILPQPMDLAIVYEDSYLLIVNKPAALIVHPTHGHYTGTLANGVVYHWKERGERVRFRPIHRLDEETSGLVAIAKTSYVHQQLSEQLQAGEVTKLYRACVYGIPAPRSGSVDGPIDRDPAQPHLRIVTPEGYPSLTRYDTLRSFGSAGGDSRDLVKRTAAGAGEDFRELSERTSDSGVEICRLSEERPSGRAAAVVRLKLETGRTHQIRVHMRHIGCPLIGDKLYGPDVPVPEWEEAVGRQALHAEKLGFRHPMTNERMEWTAPLPPELLRLERLLEREGGCSPGHER